jgi:hypothetical protein
LLPRLFRKFRQQLNILWLPVVAVVDAEMLLIPAQLQEVAPEAFALMLVSQ